VGARHDPEEVDAVFAFAAESVRRVGLLAALAEGLERAAQPLPAPARETRLQAAFSHARAMLGATETSNSDQVAAVRLLGFDPSSDARDALLKRLASPMSEMLGRVLFDALDRKGDDAVVSSVLKRWKELAPSLRAEATRFLCARPARARALLEAIRGGLASAQEIPATEAARLRQNRDPEISAAAAKLFPISTVESRDAVLRRFEPALQLAGNSKEGRALYVERCASCHRFRGEGHVFGPDLESVANGGKAKILAHLIDPNREVAPQFAAYVAELVDGSVLSGVLATESSDAVVIREPLGRETLVPQGRVKRVQTTGRSPMPEGLEIGLTQQQMANLLEFLTAGAGR
jgi:putative heme-binding domain-containing protein